MKLLLNSVKGSTTFNEALAELVEGAGTLSVAVSYLQVGGWELFKEHAKGLNFPGMRIVCTDQLGITHPAAVRRAIDNQVQIRNFVGTSVYHPKVFLAHGPNGRPSRFLIGSANLSTSAFSSSIEAGVLGTERAALGSLDRWFNTLFARQSEPFTPELLRDMDARWRLTAAIRAQNRLRFRTEMITAAGETLVPESPEDVDAMEDILSTIQLPIGLLNMDYAGNNIRNISRVREVLKRPGQADSKERSELSLLGFMRDGILTQLGVTAATAGSEAALAEAWCRWLKQTPDAELIMQRYGRLVTAKRVLSQFWELTPEVRAFFFENLHDQDSRLAVQTIELLCNGSSVVRNLSVEEIQTLSKLLTSGSVPPYIRRDISAYFRNKGTRGWNNEDRTTMLMAWRVA